MMCQLNECYRSIEELTTEEMSEIKQNLYFKLFYCSDDTEDYIINEAKDIINIDDINDAEDIPNSIIHEIYSHVSFVDEDFYCNLKLL